jgi:hypothetical protein
MTGKFWNNWKIPAVGIGKRPENSGMVGNFPPEKKSLPLHGTYSTAASFV